MQKEEEMRITIGRVLRNRRLALGITCDLVGKKLGVARSTIYAWENGERQPDADNLVAVCDLYGIKSFDELTSSEANEYSSWRSHPIRDDSFIYAYSMLTRRQKALITGIMREMFEKNEGYNK